MTSASKLANPAAIAPLEARASAGRKPAQPGLWRQGMWLSLGSVSQSALGLVQSLIVSRFYGPGPLLDALSACNGIIRYVSDVVAGMNRAFLQSYTVLARDGSRAERLFWNCQAGLFALLAVVTIISWMFNEQMLGWMYPGMPEASRAAAGLLLPLVFLGLTFTVGYQVSNAKAVVRKQTVIVAITQIAIVAATVISTLLFLPSIGLVGVLAIKAGAIAAASFTLLLFFKSRPQASFSGLEELGVVAREGAWLAFLGALSGGILLMENWLAARMPEGRLTTITWARQFSLVISMLLQGGMRQVVSVHFQELVRDGRKEELLASVRRITAYSVVVGALVVLGTLFAGQAGLQILFGGSSWPPEAIHRLWAVCSVYSFVIMVACLGGLLVPVLVATKSFRLFLLVEIIRLGSFALCAWLLRDRDLAGLAVAQVVQQFLGTGTVLVLVFYYLRCRPGWADLQLLLRLAAVILPTAAGLWLGQCVTLWGMPGMSGLAAAWRHLAVILAVASPGFGITLWLGARWEIPPIKQGARAIQRMLNGRRRESTQP